MDIKYFEKFYLFKICMLNAQCNYSLYIVYVFLFIHLFGWWHWKCWQGKYIISELSQHQLSLNLTFWPRFKCYSVGQLFVCNDTPCIHLLPSSLSLYLPHRHIISTHALRDGNNPWDCHGWLFCLFYTHLSACFYSCVPLHPASSSSASPWSDQWSCSTTCRSAER